MQFPAGVFDSSSWKGYILYDTGYHFEIKEKHGISRNDLATLMQMKKKTRSIIYCKAWDWSSIEITYDSFPHLHPDHLSGAALSNAQFLCYPGSLWGVPKPKFKDLIFKEFCQLISKIGWRVSKKQIKGILLSPIARLRIFLVMGAFLYRLLMGMRGRAKTSLSGWAQTLHRTRSFLGE